MKNIKFIAFMLLATLFSFSSCDKEEDPNPDEVYQAFLSEREPTVTGILNDTSFTWRFDENHQMWQPAHDTDDNKHSLKFVLINNQFFENHFSIRTPAFDKNFKILDTQILSKGEKKIGTGINAFAITYSTDGAMGNFHTTDVDRDQKGSSLKVLKAEKAKDIFDQDVTLVWFVVNCKLYNPNDNSEMILKDTKILASFMEP